MPSGTEVGGQSPVLHRDDRARCLSALSEAPVSRGKEAEVWNQAALKLNPGCAVDGAWVTLGANGLGRLTKPPSSSRGKGERTHS